MKSIVIYFSQTGNTELVAGAIQAGISEVTGQCDLTEIRDADPLRLKDYDLIGIGAPVIGGCPKNVLQFVRHMRFVGGKHAFTFCTHGRAYEGFYPTLYPALADRGLTVIGSADWYGNCYLLHMQQPYITAGHPDAIDLEEAETFGREMVVRSIRIRAGETDLIPDAPLPFELPKPSADAPRVPSFSNMLKFDEEKCLYPSCTLCMDNCPMHGMDLSVDPPVLAKPCLDCEFCARLCPTGALNMTPWLEALDEMTTRLAGSIPDHVAEAEERHLRRLVPLSEIETACAGYKLYTSHPQWILGKGPQKGKSDDPAN
jgi:flavodoxin/ferredoxin